MEKIETKRTELIAERSALEGEIGKSRAELESLQTNIESNKVRIDAQNEKSKETENQIERLNAKRNQLIDDLSEEDRKLLEMTRKVRLFPSEITGFVDQGNSNIRWYIALATPFCAILIIILASLFNSAADLTQIWHNEKDIDIWSILLNRLPFVLISLALIETCGYVVGRLIFEIVRINRQRLEFSKLSIIAKDVSAASASNTGLSDGEVFEKETALKMNLLREHMQAFTGSEFEYKGSAIISAIVGVANKFFGAKQT